MNDKVNIYQVEQLRAIDGFLSHKPDFSYRKICRWFSKTFNHPLLEVLEMPMPVILQHYYESQVEDADYNNIYELAQTDYLPEFMEDREIEDAAFAESLIEEQKQTLRKKAKRDKREKEAIRIAEAKKNGTAAPTALQRAISNQVSEKPQSLEKEPPIDGEPVEGFNIEFNDDGNPDGKDE